MDSLALQVKLRRFIVPMLVLAARFIQLPAICHGSADYPRKDATSPFSTFIVDMYHSCNGSQ
ncbi:hypothetical protein T10_4983 [Trichinella papuae]|uniref:Uncharacterized protein n=1 Tax=Trichinella papuae TaxID=268474 RepID=A0A0V1MRB9_9BILA|nr:hypothetical protein T10_4983 [Trichinella papuae]